MAYVPSLHNLMLLGMSLSGSSEHPALASSAEVLVCLSWSESSLGLQAEHAPEKALPPGGVPGAGLPQGSPAHSQAWSWSRHDLVSECASARNDTHVLGG